MENIMHHGMEQKEAIKSKEDLEEAIQEVEKQEQFYSMALFDILGFSNYVENNGTQAVQKLYQKLLDIIHRTESQYNDGALLSGSVVPAPAGDWKNNFLIANAGGLIRVCHFSDTFIIYTNFLFTKEAFWLRDAFYEPYPLLLGELGTEYCSLIYEEHHVYLVFLQVCIEFFCEAIKAGIPLRGCVSTGMATMNQRDSIYFGRQLVEAARGETAQNCIGIAFGRSFNNYHPVYNHYFIPYLDHIKENGKGSSFLSPMAVDWPRFWRGNSEFTNLSIEQYIARMNTVPEFTSYYDGAIKFAAFSQDHENWAEEIDRDKVTDILDYYKRVKAWYYAL